MDFGDVHDEASHAGEYILPVLLAACGLRERTSGKEFITAYAVGREVLIRIGLPSERSAVGSDRHRDGHFIFGSAIAAGKLLNLSLKR